MVVWSGWCVFFFFKQKAAFGVLRGLVGSEVCIRGGLSPLRASGASGFGEPRVVSAFSVSYWCLGVPRQHVWLRPRIRHVGRLARSVGHARTLSFLHI